MLRRLQVICINKYIREVNNTKKVDMSKCHDAKSVSPCMTMHTFMRYYLRRPWCEQISDLVQDPYFFDGSKLCGRNSSIQFDFDRLSN